MPGCGGVAALPSRGKSCFTCAAAQRGLGSLHVARLAWPLCFLCHAVALHADAHAGVPRTGCQGYQSRNAPERVGASARRCPVVESQTRWLLEHLTEISAAREGKKN